MGSSREYNKRYYQEHKERWKDYGKNRSQSHILSYPDKLTRMEKNHLNKMVVLSHYSNPVGFPICNGCGEQDLDVLCLDHKNGGGNKHRREIGTTLYNWIISSGFPLGFQVLCANCNTKKSRQECVPHTKWLSAKGELWLQV